MANTLSKLPKWLENKDPQSGFPGGYPWPDKRGQELSSILAETYFDQDKIVVILQAGQVDISYIDLEGEATMVWHDALGFAYSSMTLLSLLQAVLDDESAVSCRTRILELFAEDFRLPKWLESPAGCIFPWSDKRAQELQEILAEIYYDQTTARAILKVADVLTGRIAFSGAANMLWHNILSSVHNQDKMATLIQCVLKDESAAQYHTRLRELLADT